MSFRSFLSQQMQRASVALNNVAYRIYTRDRAAKSPDTVLDEYVAGMPTAQNAVDILPGWTHPAPPQSGAPAGSQPVYNDPRIYWAIEQYGSLERRKILELGPLEAAHTFMLDRCNPEFIHSIEANKLSYLRCLVVKEILDIKRAKFFLGDFIPWLEDTTKRYDLIVASGVLYHMPDPVRLIELMAARADAIYLWTHYYDAEAMPKDDLRQTPFVGTMEIQDFQGIPVHLHTRSYHGAWQNKSFCGGMHDLHRWIEKDDIVAVLRALGFDDIRIAHDEPNHRNGPSFSVFARRTASSDAG